jgi:Abnormal spindle-like microcephaly-assoc'd, ASPM-SPD-2-Hydin/Beta-propeller repeat
MLRLRRVRGSETSVGAALFTMRLVGGRADLTGAGVDELITKSNYFLGSDPQKWRTNVPNYAKVKFERVYHGIDVTYYGNEGQLEYDLSLAPGADPKLVALSFTASPNPARPRIDSKGNLVIEADGGEVAFRGPVAYQRIAGKKRLVSVRYVQGPENRIGFALGKYDHSRALLIDPVLSYSTYLGGTVQDQVESIAVDALGNAYIAGGTFSLDFPTTPGSFDPTLCELCTNGSIFVSKLNPTGTALVYSTYITGKHGATGNFDHAYGIAIDKSGNAYVAGQTQHSDFPITSDAYSTQFGLGTTEGFVTKLNASGSALLYSTFTTEATTQAHHVAVDSGGRAYVTGDILRDPGFPFATPGAFQTQFGGGTYDGFVLVLNPTGTRAVYATYLGGAGDDHGLGISVDGTGNAYATGYTSSGNFPTTVGSLSTGLFGPTDGYVAKLNSSGSTLRYGTYLGGSGDDAGTAIAIDSWGNAYIGGTTDSADFPTTAGAFQPTFAGGSGGCEGVICGDAFVSKLNPAGASLTYSTYLGGTDSDAVEAIAVDKSGNAYVAGETRSTNFPTVFAIQGSIGGGACFDLTCLDGFVAWLNASGKPAFSSYLGGSTFDADSINGSGFVANDAAYGVAALPGSIYVGGSAFSFDFPVTSGAYQTTLKSQGCGACGGDGFVTKIGLTRGPGYAFSPASLSFPSTPIGGTSGPLPVTLTNSGNGTLTVSTVAIAGAASGDFSQTNACSSVAPKASCTISVTFAPTAAGNRSAAISVTDNVTGNPQEVGLSGRGK